MSPWDISTIAFVSEKGTDSCGVELILKAAEVLEVLVDLVKLCFLGC